MFDVGLLVDRFSNLIVVFIIIVVIFLLFFVRIFWWRRCRLALLRGWGSLSLLGSWATTTRLIDIVLLLVSGLVLGGKGLVLRLLLISALVPSSAQLLGDLSDGGLLKCLFDTGSLIVTEPEEGRQGSLGGIGVLYSLSLLALLTLRWLPSGHLAFVSFLVLLGHVVESFLLLVAHGLPSVGALSRELGEDNIFAGVLLLVLLSARLDKVGISRHTALGLSISVLSHLQ